MSGPMLPPNKNNSTVTREYRMDMQLHLYRRAHLDDPAYRYLIPLCQENEMYPARHSGDMIGINQLSGNSFCDRCSSCDVADRRERRAAQRAKVRRRHQAAHAEPTGEHQ